jgi:aminopeptidase N
VRRSVGFAGVLLLVALSAGAAEPVRHDLEVGLTPDRHTIGVTDAVSLSAAPEAREVSFLLHAGLRIVRSEPPVREVPLGDLAEIVGQDAARRGVKVPLKRYAVRFPAGSSRLSVAYEGEVHHPLSDPKEEYTRGFRETPGLVGAEGVYLAGSSFWHPVFGPELVAFGMQVRLPEGWRVVGAGKGSSRDERGIARWASEIPVEEIHLVGGPLREFRDSAGSVEALVLLHEDDAALASKYLEATAQYLEMYRGLLGPYPYSKFALVENFWETGYGMPSFTLLGPQVIRLPFILHSSYPHEILHNWWGNSVFVDEEGGNWCEGLTAYLADHLIQEQRGRADEYRQATLQKYRDYVKAGRDFPLALFRARDSAATEAVGYGKALMGFHMLRRHIGDEAFRKTIARLYRDFKGKKASFDDIRRTAEAASGKSLGWLFGDLVARPGAAVLAAKAGPVVRIADGFEVRGVLSQTQPGPPFAVEVPVLVQTADGAVTQVVRLDVAEAPFTVRTKAAPLAVHVDPQFDVFRRLDPRETPPSIGQIFGEPAITAILPSSAPEAERAALAALLAAWKSDNHAIDVKLDSDLQAFPPARSVWVLGRSNRFAEQVLRASGGVAIQAGRIAVGGESFALANHTVVVTARHPGDVDKAVGLIACDPLSALPGLGRKLPHYGKYSYLVFEGQEPTNVAKGQWEAVDSPLRVDLRDAKDRATPLPPLKLEARKALAEAPAVFSQKALLEDVAFLTEAEREGRGLGSRGEQEAAQFIAKRFEAVGLAPGGESGTFFQGFDARGADGASHRLSNVVGLLRGTKAELAEKPVLVVAHYDHLGRGFPDVHKGDEGKLHPGADDNASGVAVMLELARNLAGGERLARSVVFVAFAGEEAGKLGSKHFADHATPFPVEGIQAVVNLDTVGRLFDRKLQVIGTGTATEWVHIVRGAGFVTGIEAQSVAEALDSSDQTSFIAKGIPAVQVFSGAHGDYHRPSDTADKLDAAGLVKVATFVREIVVYLGGRAEPLTWTAAASPSAPAQAPSAAGGRRVSLGTVPDFAFAGPGVGVSGVTPGSPAEKAGLKQGDILLGIDDKPLASLRDLADALRALNPGQTVSVLLKRDGAEMRVSVTLAER